MSKALNKYITALDSDERTLLVLSDAGSGVSLCSFTTITGTRFGIASASISLVFLITNGIVKMFFEATWRKKTNTENLLYGLGVN